MPSAVILGKYTWPGEQPHPPMRVMDNGDGTYSLAVKDASAESDLAEIKATLLRIEALLSAGITVNINGGGL